MKNLACYLVLFVMPALCWSQEAKPRFSVGVEVAPVVLMRSVGNGLQLGVYYEDGGRLLHALSLGMTYNNFNTGVERELYTYADGQPLAPWSTEVDIETNQPYPLGGVVDELDFQQLQSLGIRHFKPRLGYRLNRFLAYELLYRISRRKLGLNLGLGLTTGLTNSDDTRVGFTGNITNGFNGQTERFWVNINIRSKYWYGGATAKMMIDYPIAANFRLGVTGGLHYLFAKNFRADTRIPYAGISARAFIGCR